MKRFLLSFLFIVILSCASRAQIVIGGWDVSTMPGGTNNFGPSPLTATTQGANVTVGGLTRGAGVVTTGATGAGSAWGGVGWNNATSAANIAANKFITFTVNSNTGYSISLSSINPFSYRRSALGATNALIQFQIDAGVFSDIATLALTSSSTSGATLGPVDLSGIVALQNVASTSTVTFRIVPYGATNATGTFYIYDVANSTADDLALNGTVSVTTSNSTNSNIIPKPGFVSPSNIDYTLYQAANITLANSLEVAQFTIQDGSGAADGDALTTILTAITFTLTNSANIRRVALYDGSTELAEVAGGSTNAFSGLTLTAPDDGNKIFSIHVTFNTVVTDNQQFVFTVATAVADPSGSTFSLGSAGGAASSSTGDDNRIEVTADRLAWVQNTTSPTGLGAPMTPAVTISANDINANRDLDFTEQVRITSTGTLAGSPVDAAALSGLITFSTLTHTALGTGLTLNAERASTLDWDITSNPFDILIASSPTDYFQSVTSGAWSSIATWESSPDAVNWIPATLTPTYLANDIVILTGHTVTISSSVTVDEVAIDLGGTLEHTGGTLTIEEGDINIGSGGIFSLASAANPPVFVSGTATVQVPTFGILRVSATGLTSGAPTNGVNVSNYVYHHASVLEYTPTASFSTNGVTYFPNVSATTIPVFRVSNVGAITVGAAASTTFNGIFESNGGGVTWQSGGNKIFRNGITGAGNVGANASAASAKFIINGTTAELGGTGTITPPTTGGLEIGTPTTVTMTSDKTISGNLSLLTNTYVELGNFSLTVSGTISIATITSYVRTNGTGKLTLNNVANGGGAKLFPIGRSSFNPLFISSGTTANYSARIVEPVTPVIYNSNEAVLRTWYIASSATSPAATISFGYSYPGDCGPSFNNSGPVEVGVNVSGVWNIHQTGLTPAAYVFPGTYTVTPTNSINYFNGAGNEFPFVVANHGAVLAIDCIISARAQKRNNTGIISWTINSCADVISFEIQRSVNNGGYQTIGTISPVANQTDFNFTDPSLARGTNLYRIRVNRLSGSIKYSNIVALIYESDDILITSVVPNPAHSIATLTLSAAKKGDADFKVYNLAGRLVKQWHSNFAEGNNTIGMNVTELPAGLYQLLVTTPYTKTVIRFVKQ